MQGPARGRAGCRTRRPFAGRGAYSTFSNSIYGPVPVRGLAWLRPSIRPVRPRRKPPARTRRLQARRRVLGRSRARSGPFAGLGEEELLDRGPACRRRPRHRRDHLRRHRRAHRDAAQPRPQRAGRGALRALRAADVGEARRRGASRPRPARDDVRRDRAAGPRARATLGRRQGGCLPERRDDPRALRPGGQDLGARRPAGGRRRRPFRRRELGPRSPQPERGAGAHRSQRGDRRGPRQQQPPLAQGLRVRRAGSARCWRRP